MATMNKHVSKIARTRLEEILLAGHFPQVEFSKKNGFTSYSGMEYVLVWSTFTLVIHNKMVGAGYPQGIFQKARSAKFIVETAAIISQVTHEQISAQTTRFKTWAD